MALSSEQRGVLSEILRIGAKRGVSPLVLKSAVETGLVESGLRNLNYGDADSQGWRQERASLYKNPTNLRASINRYFDEATGFYKTGRYSNAGSLAADVQRPAAQYRGRYNEVAGQAEQLIDRFGNRVNAPARGNSRGGGRGPVVVPGRPPSAAGLGGLNVAAPDMAGLSQLLSGDLPQRQQATPIASPEFSAARYLSSAGMPIQSMQPQQQAGGIAEKLAAIGMPQGVLSGVVAQGAAGSPTRVVAGRERAERTSSPRETAAAAKAPRPHGKYRGTSGPLLGFYNKWGKDLGLSITSTKRDNTNPYSGTGSDHDYGNADAFATDVSNGSAPTPQMDEYAFRVMRSLGFKNYRKGAPINASQGVKTVNGVRYQVIYRGAGSAYGGDHTNHVHIGAKRV